MDGGAGQGAGPVPVRLSGSGSSFTFVSTTELPHQCASAQHCWCMLGSFRRVVLRSLVYLAPPAQARVRLLHSGRHLGPGRHMLGARVLEPVQRGAPGAQVAPQQQPGVHAGHAQRAAHTAAVRQAPVSGRRVGRLGAGGSEAGGRECTLISESSTQCSSTSGGSAQGGTRRRGQWAGWRGLSAGRRCLLLFSCQCQLRLLCSRWLNFSLRNLPCS